MSVNRGYKKRYKSGNTPWDTGRPDFNLIDTVTGHHIEPCKVLDIGCGTGDNSVWLAQHGFKVVGTDVSEIAIEKARGKASRAGVECDFRVVDFLQDGIEGPTFGFLFDRGCFHSFRLEDDRRAFAEKAAAHLEEQGLWLMIVGNADEKRKSPGPPQRTAGEIVSAVEPFFEIISLGTTHFESNSPTPPRAWRCLMRKRLRQEKE